MVLLLASGFKKVWMLPVLADQSLSWTQTAAGGSDVEKASGWAYVEFNQLARAQWRGKGDLIAQFLLALVIGKTRDALIVKLLDYLIEEKSCPPDLQILNALIVFTTKPALYYVHDWKKPQISSWDHSRKMYLVHNCMCLILPSQYTYLIEVQHSKYPPHIICRITCAWNLIDYFQQVGVI